MPKPKGGRSSEDEMWKIVDYLRQISHSLNEIQNVLSFSIIARYGTDEDKIKILSYLRGQYEALQRR